MMNPRRLYTASLAACLTAALGCQINDEAADSVLGEDVSSIEAALEQENGGLTFEDDTQDSIDAITAALEASEDGTEEEVEDPMEEEAEVEEMLNRPDALLFHTRIVWGQFPFNPDIEEATRWTGQMSVNRGAIVVRRTIAFDRVADSLLPRADRSVVNFRSVTLPHRDGLAITIVDPTPAAEEPLVLTYNTVENGEIFQIPVRDLVGAPQALAADSLGNKVIAMALPEAREICGHGFLAGRWHRVAEDRGVLLGRVRGPRGAKLGLMRGVYGVREDGSRVFFGKYTGPAGKARGIFAGTYADGSFKGRWIVRSGDKGVLAGRYDETIPGPRAGGFFLGRWAERACAAGDEANDPQNPPAGDPATGEDSAGQ